MPPPWDIIEDDDFAAWFDTLKGAPIPNLKELRVQHMGEPWRILFAFDRSRRAVLLVGGNKGPLGKRWYDIHIPIAVARARRHGIR